MVVTQSVLERWQNVSYSCDGEKNGNDCINTYMLSQSCKTYESCNCLLQSTLHKSNCGIYSKTGKKHDTVNLGKL